MKKKCVCNEDFFKRKKFLQKEETSLKGRNIFMKKKSVCNKLYVDPYVIISSMEEMRVAELKRKKKHLYEEEMCMQ